MVTREGYASDFHVLLPMMRQHRHRQLEFDAALYALHPDAEKRFHRWVGVVAQDPRATLLVAEEAGQIVGFLYGTIEKDPPIYLHEEFALIHEWWVEPDFRGHGAGKLLIKHVCAEFAKFGVRQLRVRLAGGDDEVREELLDHYGFRLGACELVKELEPRE